MILKASLFFIYTWMHFCVCGAEVTSPSVETAPTAYGRLHYLPSNQSLNMSDWVYRRSRVDWEGNPLVEASCEAATGGPAKIRLAAKQISEDPEYECAGVTVMAQPLAEFIDKHMMTCVQAAMRASGIPGMVGSISLQHNGIMNSRRVNNSRSCTGQSLSSGKGRSCSISSHSTGRALDLEMFDVTLTDGQKIRLPASCKTSEGEYREGFVSPDCTRVAPKGTFYDQFVRCWGDKIREDYSHCPEDQRGVLDCSHSNHVDHLHLSIPICPKPRGIATN